MQLGLITYNIIVKADDICICILSSFKPLEYLLNIFAQEVQLINLYIIFLNNKKTFIKDNCVKLNTLKLFWPILNQMKNNLVVFL